MGSGPIRLCVNRPPAIQKLSRPAAISVREELVSSPAAAAPEALAGVPQKKAASAAKSTAPKTLRPKRTGRWTVVTRPLFPKRPGQADTYCVCSCPDFFTPKTATEQSATRAPAPTGLSATINTRVPTSGGLPPVPEARLLMLVAQAIQSVRDRSYPSSRLPLLRLVAWNVVGVLLHHDELTAFAVEYDIVSSFPPKHIYPLTRSCFLPTLIIGTTDRVQTQRSFLVALIL